MLNYRKKRKKRIKVHELIGCRLSLFGVCLWPVIVSMAALLMPQAAGEDVPGVVSTTSNPSGEMCGFPPRRRCLEQSSCTQFGQCQCPQGNSGDGGFHCYSKETAQIQIVGNSLLRTFRNTSVVVGWPCRFRFTEFSTVGKGIDQTCLFQIFAANQIVGGRIVTTGFEVHLQLTKGTTTVGGLGIRTDGKASNGVFTYSERGRNQFINELPVTDTDDHYDHSMVEASGSGDGTIIDDDEDNDEEEDDKYDWGPPEELEVNGDRVSSEIDQDNFATVNVPMCGATVRFRAPDLATDDGSQTPGLSVSISKEQGRMVFQSPQTYLSETHTRSSLSKSARQKNISVEQEVLYRTMVHAARQRGTREGTECEDTARLFRSYCENTSKKIAALKSCSFFLENPDLIYCMDPPSGRASSNSLNAFKLCLWNSCRPSSPVCNLMKSRINQKGCTSLLPVNFSPLYCAV